MKELESSIASMEVAEMIDKMHSELLKDIRRYIRQFDEGKIPFVGFFQESTYTDGKGERRPCYQVTKKGCEFIAHKLTGVKGTAFTARYINRFHEMQEQIAQESEKKELVALRKQIEKQNRLLTKAMSSRITTAGSLGTMEGRYKRDAAQLLETIRSEKLLRRIYLITRTISEQQDKAL